MMQRRGYHFILPVFLLILLLGACKKLVDIRPPLDSINSANVFNSDASAIAAVTNLYMGMSAANLQIGGVTALNLYPSLSADELGLVTGNSSTSLFYYRNALAANNLNADDFWYVFYKNIFAINAAIEGLSSSINLTPQVQKQLLGEMKFMRGFCYFYLVNLYGDVPLALSTDYKVNSQLSRSQKTAVFQQIVSDLTQAQGLLLAEYTDGSLLKSSTERVRPLKAAATALLARTYLFTGEWTKAEQQASAIISNTSLYDTVPLNMIFLKNSKEAIWQLQPVILGWNTETARTYVLPISGTDASNHPFYISTFLLNSFEAGDKRKTAWLGQVTVGNNTVYYPSKYKSANYNDPVTEYETVLRLGEQYLIRAEARAQQDKVTEAQADLNIIRKRAALTATTANDKASLLAAILKERRAELFTEWGHRWFDLKRTNNAETVMSIVTVQKGGIWSRNWLLYPISQTELNKNSNLVQNDGY